MNNTTDNPEVLPAAPLFGPDDAPDPNISAMPKHVSLFFTDEEKPNLRINANLNCFYFGLLSTDKENELSEWLSKRERNSIFTLIELPIDSEIRNW